MYKFLKEGQLKPEGLRGRGLRDSDVLMTRRGGKGGHRVQEKNKKEGEMPGERKEGSGPLSEAHQRYFSNWHEGKWGTEMGDRPFFPPSSEVFQPRRDTL